MAKKLAKYPDRPDAVESLLAKVREAAARQKDAERQRKIDAVEGRELARLEALKEKYEVASVGKSTMSEDRAAG